MRSTTPDRVAPDVVRLGDDVVNFYLVEHPDGLLLVDAGLPGHLGQLRTYLASSGCAVGDIRAVLLTHAHPDHTGLVTVLHRAGAEIRVHALDAPILADGPRSALRHAKSERSLAHYLLRRPAAMGTPLHMALRGGFTAPRFSHARTFAGDASFDELPGRPRALAVPGHTAGSTAYAFPELGLLFTGDALVTHDGITGHRGPGLVCRGFTTNSVAALASLDRLDSVGDALVLPGHGDPVTDLAAATEQARRHGVS
ncbi:MBL fold metallo-hydrolase [Umezawaea sp. Da 62-37]|uniref:MBL fold metallo-hydrolase n=1 Tax=Umezawaea sp. Da 62-37 TaxID=3075927 RepID=UPI0028F70CAF|nr:MBL fold metallo-hydrolase [Umezawaea sp. Da 62-37]WNV82936.1 MBL fold metallo-hydrolase [Umezawaea sp. Da 62-37]